MSLKQKLLNMGLNVWAIDLFVESYTATTNKLLESDKDFPKEKLNLDFEYQTMHKDIRKGKVRIRIERIDLDNDNSTSS